MKMVLVSAYPGISSCFFLDQPLLICLQPVWRGEFLFSPWSDTFSSSDILHQPLMCSVSCEGWYFLCLDSSMHMGVSHDNSVSGLLMIWGKVLWWATVVFVDWNSTFDKSWIVVINNPGLPIFKKKLRSPGRECESMGKLQQARPSAFSMLSRLPIWENGSTSNLTKYLCTNLVGQFSRD